MFDCILALTIQKMVNNYSALRVICVFSLLLKYAWNVKFVKYSPIPRTQMPFSVARAFSCNCITWNRYHPQLPGIVENIEWSGRYRKRERWKRGGDGGGGAIGDSLHTNNCVCVCVRDVMLRDMIKYYISTSRSIQSGTRYLMHTS